MADGNSHYSHELAVQAYDLFVGRGLLVGDIDFYLGCAAKFGGPILEVGVGTGRIAIPLAQAGYEVVGLDLSARMLDRARIKLEGLPEIADRITFVQADMTDFSLGRTFALVLNTARSFQHITDPGQQRAALACARRHLKPGGHLVLDLFDPNFALLLSDTMPPPVEVAADRGRTVRRTVVSRAIDPLHQVIRETLRFEYLRGDAAAEEPYEVTWTLRWSTRQEIQYLLEMCGFEPVEQYSDFHASPPAYGREQLWVARAV